MIRPRLIPCLDVRDGTVVKGVRFADLREVGDPVALAASYAEQGADELTLLDVSATPEGRRHGLATLAAVRRVLPVPLTVGGGVRSIEDAEALLEAGADKVAVNSAAVAEPALLTRLVARFGRQCIVLAVDAVRAPEGGWRVATHGGRRVLDLDALVWCREGVDRGAGEILLTSLDRDGTGEGYDLDLLRRVRATVDVPVVASGGARAPEDLVAALDAGADAVLVASILHDGVTTVGAIKDDLRRSGVEVRT